jgi:uracil-DNA glycosylase
MAPCTGAVYSRAMDRATLRDILSFYADAGVDEALEEEATDRFAQTAAAMPARVEPPREREAVRSSAPPPPPPPRQVTAALPDENQAARARELAREAATLDELRSILLEFDGCNLRHTARQMVFADGNPEAALMLVGEAPGGEEDQQGLPFVGRSGRLLDRMLAAIGLDRASAYIANVVPWRPPGNRTPTPLETEICRPFIERQIELVRPKVLVALGAPSSRVLLGANEGILRLRGQWKTHRTPSGMEIASMPTLHPAYLLRNPAHKKLAWRDFLEIRARLEIG